ncbi:hypothetical protein SAMN04487948_12542 [Halogranum amylolyticum]|uniref:Uncharacterized protein n=1 Tax=Halogranum amylolyticum TaxID=660520 RepID=A0A1H8WA30_9EURY|nr:hypothetical protein [Halogranum amylolyticum]SEP23978.1 hypothetical protein SAMN04487948_12542 [Halogranum amylolyticum]
MTPRHGRNESTAVRLVGTGLLTALTLLGGVAVGGWLAFETSHWRAFKTFVEGLSVLSALHLGLLLVVVGVAAKAALVAVSTRR